MKLLEISSEDSRLFAKSEFGPLSDDWPALSFSSRKIATNFSNEYRRGRDFVVYVGTGDPSRTEEEQHRRSLLSVVSVEPRTPINTRDIVPPESWDWAINRYGVRWEWSLPVEAAYAINGFPKAPDLIPSTYRMLGKLQNLGRCVEIDADERTALLGLELSSVDIDLTPRAKTALSLNTDDQDLKHEISRLMNLIMQDVRRAGAERGGMNPLRTGPNQSEVYLMLMEKWDEQGGVCALCGADIPLRPSNRLLQMSRDRIDSADKAYDWHNVQITHYGCNLAKSDATMDEWREFLSVIRVDHMGHDLDQA